MPLLTGEAVIFLWLFLSFRTLSRENELVTFAVVDAPMKTGRMS
jgi:hypothetical protein